MEQLKGFSQPGQEHFICKLKMSLYGYRVFLGIAFTGMTTWFISPDVGLPGSLAVSALRVLVLLRPSLI
jgi:hypothetical protein